MFALFFVNAGFLDSYADNSHYKWREFSPCKENQFDFLALWGLCIDCLVTRRFFLCFSFLTRGIQLSTRLEDLVLFRTTPQTQLFSESLTEKDIHLLPGKNVLRERYAGYLPFLLFL